MPADSTAISRIDDPVAAAVWIAMPWGSHVPKMEYRPVKMVQFSGPAYLEGIETHERDQVPLRVYGVAKTIADCLLSCGSPATWNQSPMWCNPSIQS
ncbi:type IV toxin-antitoxin system AbiEi family antitoxin domain-containing protein [Noviherbaspirillum sedimenti]|uniref:type IV toxin-antitoxin system AbiEi family antitoxin domain-containing protein n=1 Tax=Noviherbaspirillum sedimenti TaxID=2320865 RepID=UPI0011C36EF2|nr:hypothetical protein [Noviherbaspirillum sedimenti]